MLSAMQTARNSHSRAAATHEGELAAGTDIWKEMTLIHALKLAPPTPQQEPAVIG